MGREEAMDSNFRERFLALQRLEMANPGYVCPRRNADPESTAHAGARRGMRTHSRTRAKVVKDADTLGAGA
jgi:hypothetical protein